MSYSTQRAVSDGSLALLDINIEYFDREEITVYFNSVQDAYPWNWVGTTDNQLAFSPAVPIGIEVLVKRTTDISEPRHLFNAGAAFTEATLDEVLLQNLHIAQEAKENATIEEVFTNLNMHGYKVRNVGDPVDPTDAVNLRSFAPHDAQIIVYRGQCEAARDAAAESAVEAANSAASVNAVNLAQKDGTNAEGTWDINISGTAANAAVAALANSIADNTVSTGKIVDASIPPSKLSQQSGGVLRTVGVDTALEYTAIPVWVTEIVVQVSAIATSSNGIPIVQLGSGSYTTSGYLANIGWASGDTSNASGFPVTPNISTNAQTGALTLRKMVGSNRWTCSGTSTSAGTTYSIAGSVLLTGVLDRVRVAPNAAAEFSAGTISITWR